MTEHGSKNLKSKEGKVPEEEVMGEGSAALRSGSSWSDEDPRRALTPTQLEVMRDLAKGGTVSEVATRRGIHPERIKRWQGTSRFQRALSRESEPPGSLGSMLRDFTEGLMKKKKEE